MTDDAVKSWNSSILLTYFLHVLDDCSFLDFRENSVFKQKQASFYHLLVNHDFLVIKREFRD